MMVYKIYISENITLDHPSLIPRLDALFATRSLEEDVTIATAIPLLPGVRSVEWDDESRSLRAELKLLWIDGAELEEHINDATLGRFIERFREAYLQNGPSERTLLLIYRPRPARRMEIEIEMCQRVLQSSCLYRIVETPDEVADVIFSYMCGFWQMIANPTAVELREDFRRMLLVLPSMTPERADLVTARFSCWRHLMEAFEELEPQVQTGPALLNSSLFSASAEPSDVEEPWVRELYNVFTAHNPEMSI
ncbi:hypothetical protein AAF712_005536 [Marasmius tenuissimus]|uniref:Uncharacterized protein n=1 Tax=Marasmius tenuissimus TaxID=585030 RepID=A0ABR3A1B7_9AGAR